LTGVWKEGDHRDWEAINKWAGELKDKLTDTSEHVIQVYILIKVF
jgi:hypothetical protein